MFGSFVGRTEGHVENAFTARGLLGPSANKGAQVLALLTKNQPCKTADATLLSGKLNEARAIATQLALVESAINLINAESPERQAEFSRMEQQFRHERDQAIEQVGDTLKAFGFDVAGAIYEGIIPSGSLYEAEAMQRPKDIHVLESLWDILREASKSQNEDRWLDTDTEVIHGLFHAQFPPNMVGVIMHSRLARANEWIEIAEGARDGYKTAHAWVAANRGTEIAGKLTKKTEQESAMLRDDLLPRQRALSVKLDSAMKDPVVKSWMDGGLKSCP